MKHDYEEELFEYLRKKLHPTDGERVLREMSDEKLLELTWDIIERDDNYYWGLDEQQYDGIHKMVNIRDVIAEANFRKLKLSITKR